MESHANGQASLPYRDRAHAGRVLAAALMHLADRDDVLVIALPRGGAVIGFEVAQALHAPMDVLIVRKLGRPEHEEFAIGAIASGGAMVLNDAAREIAASDFANIVSSAQTELKRREHLYREGSAMSDPSHRTVVVVDDGLATGATMLVAVAALRRFEPTRIIVAAPVGARETCDRLEHEADAVVCLATPDPFRAVGLWYENFDQVSDEEMKQLLANARSNVALAHGTAASLKAQA